MHSADFKMNQLKVSWEKRKEWMDPGGEIKDGIKKVDGSRRRKPKPS